MGIQPNPHVILLISIIILSAVFLVMLYVLMGDIRNFTSSRRYELTSQEKEDRLFIAGIAVWVILFLLTR